MLLYRDSLLVTTYSIIYTIKSNRSTQPNFRLCAPVFCCSDWRLKKMKSKKSAEQALKLNQRLEEKQQELHNALVEAQSANKSKTSFLNNMSHDIRTPINGIIGMLTILEKGGNDRVRAKDCMNKIS